MTTATLKEYTLKDLAQMAKKRGIAGWHSMRKGDLIRALVRDEKQASRTGAKRGSASRAAKGSSVGKAGRPTAKSTQAVGRPGSKRSATNGHSRPATAVKHAANGGHGVVTQKSNGRDSNGSGTCRTTKRKATAPPQLSAVARKIQKAHRREEESKDLSGRVLPVARKQPAPVALPEATQPPPFQPGKDRIVLMVRDAYWLHAHWELTSRSVQRAQAAMAEYWHTSKPVIRVMEVSMKGTTSTTETFVRDVVIHGGVNNWYIDVVDPPKAYRVEIGYLASNGRFHGLARSNCVSTPEPGAHDASDRTWVDVAENCERIFALSGGYSNESSTEELQEVLEERLRRPVGSPMTARYGVGADPTLEKDNGFTLDVDAEMIVFGSTRPGSHVTLGGEPIKVRDDGSFRVRMSLPERRQVLPVTSSSGDGMTQQTVVLAVERNTKVMEAVIRDSSQ